MVAAALVTAACGGGPAGTGTTQSGRAATVTLDGSSTVFPISEAVAEEFQKSKKNAIKVTVGISGTGGGFKKFCRGEIDIADASRPILKKEMEACKEGVKYLGENFMRGYVAVKRAEHENYKRVISSWEREFLLSSV